MSWYNPQTPHGARCGACGRDLTWSGSICEHCRVEERKRDAELKRRRAEQEKEKHRREQAALAKKQAGIEQRRRQKQLAEQRERERRSGPRPAPSAPSHSRPGKQKPSVPPGRVKGKRLPTQKPDTAPAASVWQMRVAVLGGVVGFGTTAVLSDESSRWGFAAFVGVFCFGLGWVFYRVIIGVVIVSFLLAGCLVVRNFAIAG